MYPRASVGLLLTIFSCPNGESVTEMEHRVDGVIERVSYDILDRFP
jgi:hypothetical protein